MAEPSVYLSVVIPLHKGFERLAAQLGCVQAFLQAQPRPAELILVDDSGERDRDGCGELCQGVAGVTVLHNETNRGKGYSVARGMLAASGIYRVFTDADLAYPVTEIAKIVRDLEDGSDVAIACRVLPESRYLISPSFFHYLYTRHLMSRAFNRLVRMAFLPKVLDTQAGLKGFAAHAAELVFRRLTVDGFGFDVEALYIAAKHRLRIRQTAVAFRYDNEPSTVRFARDAAAMLRDLAKIRWNDWRGRYA